MDKWGQMKLFSLFLRITGWQRTPQKKFHLTPLISLLTLCLLLSYSAVRGDNIQDQRKQYLQAQNALRAGKFSLYKQITSTLEDYPLYPYLIYDYLRPRLPGLNDAEIAGFLERYSDLPVADDLRRAWLMLLARSGRWQTFLDHYASQEDTVLRCYQLQARINTQNTVNLLEDIRSLWLAGQSQPDACDPAFDVLSNSELMNSELVWERIRLAMQNRQTSLAKYLSQRLDSEGQEWVSRWIATYHNPSRWIKNPGYKDVPVARDILTQGMTRLATTNIDAALARWQELKSAYTFNAEQHAVIQRTLAIRAVLAGHPRTRELLENMDDTRVDEDMFQWRLRNALEDQDWAVLINWTEAEPSGEALRLRRAYWRARALEQTGQTDAAASLYRSLADERDYYGFLAADRISAPYKMAHTPSPEDYAGRNEVAATPAVKRAHEFYRLGNRYMARREWNHALKGMTPYQMQIAAMIAADWNWHDRTILTLGQARAYDDLILRFPLVYRDEMQKYAEMRKLDLGWMYALTRAESAFMVDARSPAGALGLMQVMPATGTATARTIGLGAFKTTHLLEANKNITVGTAYLKQVYDRFGNKVLATAAYNAGPNAVSRWLPEKECVEPDIWVETIPFPETRKYVARIMFYATIYDWRLQNEPVRVNERMAVIQPRQQSLAAAQTCPATLISRR